MSSAICGGWVCSAVSSSRPPGARTGRWGRVTLYSSIVIRVFNELLLKVLKLVGRAYEKWIHESFPRGT